MSTTTEPQALADAAELNPGGKKSKRKSTSHLKLVPESKALREEMRLRCADVASKLDKSRPLSKDEMEQIARRLLTDNGQPEGFLGWVMVMLASEFWREQVAGVPFDAGCFCCRIA